MDDFDLGVDTASLAALSAARPVATAGAPSGRRVSVSLPPAASMPGAAEGRVDAEAAELFDLGAPEAPTAAATQGWGGYGTPGVALPASQRNPLGRSLTAAVMPLLRKGRKRSRGLRLETTDLEGRTVEEATTSAPPPDGEPAADASNPTGSSHPPPPPPVEASGPPVAAAEAAEAPQRWRQKRRAGGRWTAEEDEIFIDGLRRLGPNFSLLKLLFPGRTRADIISKYRNECRSGDRVDRALLPGAELPVDVDDLTTKAHAWARARLMREATPLGDDQRQIIDELEAGEARATSASVAPANGDGEVGEAAAAATQGDGAGEFDIGSDLPLAPTAASAAATVPSVTPMDPQHPVSLGGVDMVDEFSF